MHKLGSALRIAERVPLISRETVSSVPLLFLAWNKPTPSGAARPELALGPLPVWPLSSSGRSLPHGSCCPRACPQLRDTQSWEGEQVTSPCHGVTDPDSSGATFTVTFVSPMTPAHPAAGGRSGNRSPPKGSVICTRSCSACWWPGRPQGGARPPSFTGSQARLRGDRGFPVAVLSEGTGSGTWRRSLLSVLDPGPDLSQETGIEGVNETTPMNKQAIA